MLGNGSKSPKLLAAGRCDTWDAFMTDEQGLLLEIVRRLEKAWNNGDSVAWTAEFADDADFIHVLGGFFHGRPDIERGHRTIFDNLVEANRAGMSVLCDFGG